MTDMTDMTGIVVSVDTARAKDVLKKNATRFKFRMNIIRINTPPSSALWLILEKLWQQTDQHNFCVNIRHPSQQHRIELLPTHSLKDLHSDSQYSVRSFAPFTHFM